MCSEIQPLSCLHRASPSASDESPTAALWLGCLADSPPAPAQKIHVCHALCGKTSGTTRSQRLKADKSTFLAQKTALAYVFLVPACNVPSGIKNKIIMSFNFAQLRGDFDWGGSNKRFNHPANTQVCFLLAGTMFVKAASTRPSISFV